MGLKELDRGARKTIHVGLLEDQIFMLDRIAKRYKSNRSKILGALIDDAFETARMLDVTKGNRPGQGRPEGSGDPERAARREARIESQKPWNRFDDDINI